METFKFAMIAQDHTSHWNLPEDSTLADCQIFTLSIFAVGEATYCCSLTPSSYADDVENAFYNRDGSYLTEEQISEQDRTGVQYEGLDHTYIGYVDPDRVADNPRIGDICEIEIDPDDHDGDREAMRNAAWEDAREEMRANQGAYEPDLTEYVKAQNKVAA